MRALEGVPQDSDLVERVSKFLPDRPYPYHGGDLQRCFLLGFTTLNDVQQPSVSDGHFTRMTMRMIMRMMTVKFL